MGQPAPALPYYRRDLALVHHLGFGFHADACAPGILAILHDVADSGVVLELGCGSGLLTRHLVDAGHRVIATDASSAMLELAKLHATGAEDFRLLTLPDEPVPAVDAIVSVGHVLNYLPDEGAIERALIAMAGALKPGGAVAFDLCDFEWGRARTDVPPLVRRSEDWVLMTEFETPVPERFVRRMTTFVRNPDGSWRRDDEVHDNVLVDVSRVPSLLGAHGVEASVSSSFGGEELPVGLMAVVGRRPLEG